MTLTNSRARCDDKEAAQLWPDDVLIRGDWQQHKDKDKDKKWKANDRNGDGYLKVSSISLADTSVLLNELLTTLRIVHRS